MEKTAIAQLIEKLEWYRDNELLSKPEMRPLNYCINTAREYLQKEKEQIKDAYIDGVSDLQEKYKDGEDYFTQTYNQ